ncbi:membrane-targeted effector domain-containing toxin [Pseudomonas sp. XS1P51]
MNTSETNSPSLLPDAAEEQSLKALALPFAEACPDLHTMAHDAAQGILDKHRVEGIDPDKVWWHRFNNTSVSSTKAFLFWEHFPKPSESLTLPQLVVKRFRPHDQDNADLLDGDGGFYNEGAHASVFNETNEVRMYPSEVLKDLWAINFSERYREKMERFWTLHSDDFRTLAKLNFLAKALDEHDGARLNNENLKTVIKAVAGNVTWPINLKMLQATAPTIDGLHVCALDIGGYKATDILCITDRNGVQILYTPGETQPFNIFATPSDLHWWLLMQNNHAQNRARFMAHFSLAAQQQDDGNIGLNAMIDLLYSTWGTSDHHLINQKAEPISGDVFSWLRDSVEARMRSDADLSLRSNGDLREKMWIGYLNAFVHVFGSMAALGWPVALAAVGAGIADMGLNIDQAVNGSTKADRKAGLVGAISSGIETLFNLPFLRGAAEFAEVGEASETFSLQERFTEPLPADPAGIPPVARFSPGPAYAEQGTELLSSFETNEILDGLSPITEEGQFQGIFQPPTGGNYVQINDSFYLVRYSNELKVWAIIDPANPYSFYRSLPIRLDVEGEWQPINRLGLSGGGKFDGLWPWGHASEPLPDIDSPPTAYDVPQALREDLREIAQGGGTKYDVNDSYTNTVHKPDGSNPTESFKALRKTLNRDAIAFLESNSLPARPEIPNLPPNLAKKDIIKKLFRIASGLVIGENHSSVASKQFLIENMEVLSKQKVKTLYMEHLLTDFHQADLDVFNRTGVLSENLENYLKTLDRGFKTDPSGQFNFLEVVKAARRSHIRVQAIDCMASYKSTGMKGVEANFRQRMMNFFTHEVIRTDQTTRGAHRWVALVGDSHANTWEGVPGISELEGGIGLRIESTPAGTARGIEVDPGRIPTDNFGRPLAPVKSDLRLQLDTPPDVALTESMEHALRRTGDCTVMNIDDTVKLIHRSRDGALVRTPILRDQGSYYIERPSWPSISGRRYASVAELSTALRLSGLRPIQMPQS